MTGTPPREPLRLLHIFGVAAAAACVLLSCMHRDVAPFDEGLILTGAMDVLHGAVPHRDFFATYGPGQFYCLALWFKLFSPSVLVERAWDTTARVMVSILVFRIASRVSPLPIAWLCALACAIWMAYFGYYSYPVFPALCALLGCVLLAQPAGQEVLTRARLVCAGLCNAVCFLFLYDVGAATLGIMTFILAARIYSYPAQASRHHDILLWALAAYYCGFFSLVAPLAAAYTALHVWDGFAFDVISYAIHIYPRMRALPFPAPQYLTHHLDELAIYLPLAISGVAIISLLRVHQQWVSFRPTCLLVGTFLLCTLILYCKAMVRVDVTHMAMAILLSLLLLGLLKCPPFDASRLCGISISSVFLFAWFCSIIPLRLDLAWIHENLLSLARPANATPTDIPRLAGFAPDNNRDAAVRYIRLHTRPGDTLYVGADRHDKLFVGDIAIYFLADRQPATRWYVLEPGIQTTARIQKEIISDLERTHPLCIVIESYYDKMAEPNGSALSSGVMLLDDYIRSRYHPVVTYGNITVEQHNGPGHGARAEKPPARAAP